MPRAPKIPAHIRELIVRQAIEQLDKPRQLLATELRERIEHNAKIPSIPEINTIAKIISAARHKVPRNEDPWSVGASILHNIPDEANSDLIKIWKWCIVIGRTFNVREAKWAAKLRGAVPFSSLLYVAAYYALEEQVAEAFGKPLDTTSLDLYMLCFPDDSVIKNKIQFDARRLGLIPSRGAPPLSGEERPKVVDRLNPDLLRMDDPISKVIERLTGVYNPHVEELSDDGDALYAMWLKKLSQGQNWEQLSGDSHDEMAMRLFREVKEICDKANSEHIPLFNLYPEVMHWQPSKQLLDKAGVTIE
ncbi:hypothetical protein ACFLX4_01185 [Chloroflexota bacterium]